MFNWIKNKLKKKEKETKDEIRYDTEEDLEGLAIASMRYVVDKEGIVYLDFFWDSDASDSANETFSILFSQINTGDLLEESMNFIEETLTEKGEVEEFQQFYDNVLEIQRSNIGPFLESLGIDTKETDDEVVVKPTDIADRMFKGNQT